jgi:putative transcriptional regulator
MIKNNLSAIMGAKRIKIHELQKLSGISRSTITRLYYDKTTTVSFKTLEYLCKALNCTLNDLFEII